jgi:hypothetical protein
MLFGIRWDKDGRISVARNRHADDSSQRSPFHRRSTWRYLPSALPAWRAVRANANCFQNVVCR